jgi:Flp pilus assembly protein TadB
MTAVAAREKPVPRWRWVIWSTTLFFAVIVFYVLLAPVWQGLRIAAWVAEFRRRRRRS